MIATTLLPEQHVRRDLRAINILCPTDARSQPQLLHTGPSEFSPHPAEVGKFQ